MDKLQEGSSVQKDGTSGDSAASLREETTSGIQERALGMDKAPSTPPAASTTQPLTSPQRCKDTTTCSDISPTQKDMAQIATTSASASRSLQGASVSNENTSKETEPSPGSLVPYRPSDATSSASGTTHSMQIDAPSHDKPKKRISPTVVSEAASTASEDAKENAPANKIQSSDKSPLSRISLPQHQAHHHEIEPKQTATSKSAQQPSRKRARSPSPVEPAPTPPPARPTIRLELALTHKPTSKSDYIFQIPNLAVDQLQDQHPEWTAWYKTTYLDQSHVSASHEVGLSAQELHDLGGLAKLLHKYPSATSSSQPARKRRVDEYDVGSYDTKDPFVDDSELGVDEPTHIVRTRADGFYVARGPVELARAKSSSVPSSRSASSFRSSFGASLGRGWAAGRTNKLLAKRAASRSQQQQPRHDQQPQPQSQQPSQNARQGVSSEISDSTTTSLGPETRSGSAASLTSGPAPGPVASSSSAAPLAGGSSAMSLTAPSSSLSSASPSASVCAPGLASSTDIIDKKKDKYPKRPVHPQLQAMFDQLKALVSKASFAVKTKFPPELKPPLIETAKVAVELDEYNENFFNYLPSIFPYNRFTMMKLTKREFFHKHMAYFKELQEEHIEKLSQLIEVHFPSQAAEYEALCRERGVEGKDNTDHGADDDTEAAPDESRTSIIQPEADDLVKRFRWSDDMRDTLFTIVTVENAMSEIRNEKLYVSRQWQ